MASALIPLALNVVPLLFPLVAKLMDRIFGDKTGAVKLPTGSAVLQTILTALQKSLEGTGVSLPVDMAEIQKTLQATVEELNAKGQLKGAATVIEPAATAGTPPGLHALGLTLLDAARDILRLEGAK